MFQPKFVLATLVVACSTFAAASAAGSASDTQSPRDGTIRFRTILQADLTIQSDLMLGTVSIPESKAPRHGFCRCGCGVTCETSADCGGAACEPFITCCVRGTPEQPLGLGKSTRYAQQPTVRVKCK